MVIISVKQQYPGHATQVAALIMGMPESANFLKYVVIVDDDINPYDIEDVLWQSVPELILRMILILSERPGVNH